MTDITISRRSLLLAAPALALHPAALSAETATPETTPEPTPVPRNISAFRTQNWQDHFSELGVATIVADTASRALHFWSGDGATYRMFPTSVPISEELTKRGYTQIVRKRIGPDWTPTPSMIERNPDLKYMPPGPDNPLGTHAMYLDWPAYLIHGTHDTRKIGRRSSDGCIGLYNEAIAQLYELTPVGTQVRLI